MEKAIQKSTEGWEERFDSYISKFLTTDTSKTVVKDFIRHIREEVYDKGYIKATAAEGWIKKDIENRVRTDTLDRVLDIVNEIDDEAKKGQMKIVDIFQVLLTKITSMRRRNDE